MDQNALYEEDVHAWAEHQSELLRRLARTRHDLPKDLDLEHIAEEVEDVGNIQRAAAKSLMRQILIHLIKLHLLPENDAANHWRGEIVTFHDDLQDRLDPSMRVRIDLDDLWRRSVRQVRLSLEREGLRLPNEPVFIPPGRCPVDFADFRAADFDTQAALAAIREAR